MPGAWSLPVNTRLLNRVSTSFSPLPTAIRAAGGNEEGVWWLVVLGDGKGGLLAGDAGDFAHAVVAEQVKAERAVRITE